MGISSLSRKPLRIAFAAGLAISTLLANGTAVALLWAQGVDFATLYRQLPNGSGFQIKPLVASYKWLLGILLLVNIGLLIYLLVRQKSWYALGFALGASVPMGYLILILTAA